jgi:hypothetical protein
MYASLTLQIWERGGKAKYRMYNNTVYRDTVAMKNNQAPANLSQLINT